MILSGARQGYETTFRVLAYAQGSTAWMQVIPIFGPLIGGIWALVIEIVGLSKAHEISAGKATLAVFLPVIFCLVVCGIMFVVIFLTVGAAGIAGANQ
jgi:hypothetical protein